MDKSDLRKILFILAFILIFTLLAVTIWEYSISNGICQDKCYQDGALYYEVMYSGKWDYNSDVCMCYFPDHIKSFKVGG